MDLVTRERALRNLASLTSPTAAEYLAIDTMIRVASNAIEKYCQRSFGAQQKDELYNGTDSHRMTLRDFPIISVDRIAYGPTGVLRITNTSSSNQRATVKVTSTGITLTHVASATTTVNTLAFATYTTITALNTAINALGSGWSSTIASSTYNNWASADLRAIQGAMGCKDTNAEIRIHTSELTNYEIDDRKGIITMGYGVTDFPGEQPTWYGGINYWRIIYTAGYETVPEDVQEACAQWTAALFWQTKRDPGLQHEAVVGSVSRSPYGYISPAVIELLRPYRKHQFLSLGG